MSQKEELAKQYSKNRKVLGEFGVLTTELQCENAFIAGWEASNNSDEPKYNWIKASELLPSPQLLENTGNDYCMVQTENFGIQKAMYINHPEYGNCWFLSYISLLTVPVLEWAAIKKITQ